MCCNNHIWESVGVFLSEVQMAPKWDFIVERVNVALWKDVLGKRCCRLCLRFRSTHGKICEKSCQDRKTFFFFFFFVQNDSHLNYDSRKLLVVSELFFFFLSRMRDREAVNSLKLGSVKKLFGVQKTGAMILYVCFLKEGSCSCLETLDTLLNQLLLIYYSFVEQTVVTWRCG